jgi:protein-L-isoaspartate(D-aspartate) O-methyltransferase
MKRETGSDLAVATKRAAYAAAITAGLKSAPEGLEQAFATVPREAFLGPPPWRRATLRGVDQAPEDDPLSVYENVLFELDGRLGVNNGEPRLWATAFDAVAIKRGEVVLHVGAGTGYYTALMSHLVGRSGRVIGAEIEPHLAKQAQINLRPWRQAQVFAASGLDLETPQLDLVVASAGASTVPARWLERLKEGGRLLMPLTAEGDWPRPDGGTWRGGWGGMLVVQRQGARYAARFTQRVGFYPCIGARDPAAEKALLAAFTDENRSLDEVRSLRLSSQPDQSCWVAGTGWWLSSQA